MALGLGLPDAGCASTWTTHAKQDPNGGMPGNSRVVTGQGMTSYWCSIVTQWPRVEASRAQAVSRLDTDTQKTNIIQMKQDNGCDIRVFLRPLVDGTTAGLSTLGCGVVRGSILCDPIQPNQSADCSTRPDPLQVEKSRPNLTQPNTTNKFNCLLQPNVI